jgi:hypothetical protein
MCFQLLRGTTGRFKCEFSWSCFGMTKAEAGTPGFLFAPLGMHSSHTFEEMGVRSPLVYRFENHRGICSLNQTCTDYLFDTKQPETPH